MSDKPTDSKGFKQTIRVQHLKEGDKVIIPWPNGERHEWRVLNIIPSSEGWVNVALLLPGYLGESFGMITMNMSVETYVDAIIQVRSDEDYV